MHNIILIAETGSDLTPEAAAELGVYLVPMHVQMDGKLMAQKKYRGSMDRILPKMLKEYFGKYNVKRDHIYLIEAPGFSDKSKAIVESTLKEMGYSNYS